MSIKKILVVLAVILLFLGCTNNEKEYNKLIKTADSLYRKDEFVSAKSLYQKALEKKPLDSVLYKKIIKTNRALMMRNKEAQYHKVIIIADNYFNKKQYVEAQKAYINASKIKKDIKYVQDRIAAIDTFLIKSEKQQLKPYYIIVGSFKNKTNATRLNEKLLSNGFNSVIIPRFEGAFNAVSYTSHLNAHDALDNLNSAKRSMHPESWVLKYDRSTE